MNFTKREHLMNLYVMKKLFLLIQLTSVVYLFPVVIRYGMEKLVMELIGIFY